MDWIIPLVALTVMEIVLGIDNIVFIALLSGRLPEKQQAKARSLGLIAALVMRLALLLTLSWILGLTQPIFSLEQLGLPESWLTWFGTEVNEVSWRDLILVGGGLFLIAKSVHEIHKKMEGESEAHAVAEKPSFAGVLVQIAIFDIIFSLDSVITAVGMVKTEGEVQTRELLIMVAAIVIAIGVMLAFANKVSLFIEQHPTLKMLALSFMILIGVMLTAEGIGTHINKGYIYFAMAFSLLVEGLNLRLQSKTPAADKKTL